MITICLKESVYTKIVIFSFNIMDGCMRIISEPILDLYMIIVVSDALGVNHYNSTVDSSGSNSVYGMDAAAMD